MPALPNTEPTCRVVLYTPEPAPACAIGRLRVAVVVSGDQTNPCPTPSIVSGASSVPTAVSGCITADNHTNPPQKHASPKPARLRGCARSASLPTNGARMPESPATGTINSAARSGDSPSTL